MTKQNRTRLIIGLILLGAAVLVYKWKSVMGGLKQQYDAGVNDAKANKDK